MLSAVEVVELLEGRFQSPTPVQAQVALRRAYPA